MSITEGSAKEGLGDRNVPQSTPPPLQWYLVHCRPREDERALEHLGRQGYECYRPVRRIERLRHGRKALVTESLFPRYLFIRLSCIEDNWYPIRSTRGVHEIVRCAGEPIPVRDRIVESIRLQLGGIPPEPVFKSGERVLLEDPPFSQLEAIFIANEGDERVVLLLNILQHEQRMSFPLRSVRKLG